MELFVILGETESLKGIRASAIRQLRLHRKLINPKFREDPINRQLFMRLLRSPYKLSVHLKLMNRYGILGSYLPEFGKIVGQTQHDLFHIYPVDVHTLELITNIRRLVQPNEAAKFPVSSHIFKNLPKPELIIIAALYHDIAKGRGGDHSILGAVDVAEFGERHGLQAQEISLLQWLIENHLLMSTISQREDTSDPDVIYKFAKHVGDQRHLDHLWVLTVADINATNPRLWTEWKGALMSNLYFETKQVLQSGLDEPTNRDAWVNDAKNSVLQILDLNSVSEDQAQHIWGDVDDQFFLRERAEDIAFFTKGIIDSSDEQAVIQIRDVGVEIPVATQIFLHTKSTKNLFAIVAATLDKLGLTIQDARLQTTSDDRTFDVFYVLDDNDLPVGSNKKLCKSISDSLKTAIQSPEKINLNVSRRTSRQLKNFTMKTKVSLRNDSETDTSILQVITPDRPGLLAKIGNIFERYDLILYNAKISTLGERVEDTFYLRTHDNQPIDNDELGENLKQTIRNELDSRIKEAEQESIFQSIKIGR